MMAIVMEMISLDLNDDHPQAAESGDEEDEEEEADDSE